MSAALDILKETLVLLNTEEAKRLMKLYLDKQVTVDELKRRIDKLPIPEPPNAKFRGNQDIQLTQKEFRVANNIQAEVKTSAGVQVVGIDWQEILSWLPGVMEIYGIGKATWLARPANEASPVKLTHAVEAATPRAMTLARQIIADFKD